MVIFRLSLHVKRYYAVVERQLANLTKLSSHPNVKQMHPKQPGYGGKCQLSPTDRIKSVN